LTTVILAGAFGQSDPGGEAVLAAFRTALPGCDLLVASSDPAQTQARHRVGAFLATDTRTTLHAVRECEAALLTGSSLSNSLAGSTRQAPHDRLRTPMALALAAKVGGRILALFGVDVRPPADWRSRRLARLLARHADLLVVRDEESASALIAAGVPGPLRVGADPAWALLDAPTMEAGSRWDEVVVVISRHVATPEHLPQLAAGLARLPAAGLRLRVQPWRVGGPGPDDLDVAEQLAALVGGAATVVAPPADLPSASAQFRNARLVVAMRFHALVAATAAGTPCLAVQRGGSLASLARRLRQPWAPPTVSPDELAAASIGALESGSVDPASVQAETAAARGGFALLRLVLGDGAGPVEQVNGLRLEPAP
jgi:polysaccharide pyruvyl transferase WcaK-like protein